MDELIRLLALLGVAGVAVTVLAGIVRWRANEGRRIRRGLRVILKGDTHGFLAALGRGRGIGFNFDSNQVAVVWDSGAWGFLYSLDELVGAEVIVDNLVVGRVHRGEARKALDAFDAVERVALRLVFDDLAHPDFVLDLWLPEDEGRRAELPPGEAIAEANRWLARIEALLRRPATTRRPAVTSPAAPQVATAVEPPSEPTRPAAQDPSPPPLFQRMADEDDKADDFEDDAEEEEEEEEEEEDEIRSARL
jgi:hypothetical protein